MPVRKIPKNYRNVTGVAASCMAMGSAGFESTLERDFLTLLEFRRDIDSFEVQPVRIDWVGAQGIERSYTPDVLVFPAGPQDRAILCEVKYRSEIQQL